MSELLTALAERRKALGLTQKEVARRMGTTQPRVAALESGKQSGPRLSTIFRFAAAVEATIEVKDPLLLTPPSVGLIEGSGVLGYPPRVVYEPDSELDRIFVAWNKPGEAPTDTIVAEDAHIDVNAEGHPIGVTVFYRGGDDA